MRKCDLDLAVLWFQVSWRFVRSVINITDLLIALTCTSAANIWVLIYPPLSYHLRNLVNPPLGGIYDISPPNRDSDWSQQRVTDYLNDCYSINMLVLFITLF